MQKLILTLATLALTSGLHSNESSPQSNKSNIQPKESETKLQNLHPAGSDLDNFIPMPVQKKYGLNMLTTKQRNEIASWLKEHQKRAPSETSSNLSLNISNGQFIQLDDGSVWEISPNSLDISQGWLSPVEIKITQSGNSKYPYRLYNSATKDSADAKRVTMQQSYN